MNDKNTVLIFDSDISSLNNIKAFVSSQYNTYEAQNISQAYECIDNCNVDLIIASFEENNLNLFDFIKERQSQKTPIILTLNYKNQNIENEIMKLGIHDIIIKPVEKRTLIRHIELVIKESRLEKTKYRADHDSLTGIYNADAFYKITDKLIKKSKEKNFVIARISVDKFNIIKDIFGNEMADRILCRIASYIAKEVNGYTSYGRITENDFALFIPAEYFNVEDILAKIDDCMMNFDFPFKINVNMGIYQNEYDDKNTLTVAQMTERAGLAIQELEGNYGVNYAFYDKEMHKKIINEKIIENDMDEALITNQFVIFLQPIYGVSTLKPCAAEALVRWMHPSKGLLAPNEFVPIFEKNGSIIKLDMYMFEAVCRYQHQKLLTGEELMPISVNFSRASIYSEGVVDDMVRIIDGYGIGHDYVRIEITEAAYTYDPEQIQKTVDTLHENRFKVLMDDFGSGYSSLNMLKDISIDVLKIDMNFIDNLDNSPKTGVILTSVVNLGKWLNIPVVVEGVESSGQLEFLKNIGCDYVQGYYFSKPLEPHDFLKKISENINSIAKNPICVSYDEYASLFSGNEAFIKMMNSLICGVGIYEFSDNKLNIIRVNDSYYSILGYNPDLMYNDHFSHLCTNVDKEISIQLCKEVVLGKSSRRKILRYRHADGKILYLDSVYTYLGGVDNRPLIGISFYDITEYANIKFGAEISEDIMNI